MPLYDKITKVGTLSEPKGAPDPIFALPSTVNWMHALKFLVGHYNITGESCRSFYAHVQRRKNTEHQENTIFEQLLFALHQCAAINSLRSIEHKSDVIRIGIVTWYYGIYAAASAMVTAQDGSFQDDHTGTANVWDRQIAARKLIMPPFDSRLSSLVKKDADLELATLLTFPRFNLAGIRPTTEDEALGACHAYLSGSANWWRWRTEEDVRSSKEFKGLGASDFRTKVARGLRDKRLSGKAIGFLHQASRYRGKANYREALFLGYGSTLEKSVSGYIDDLSDVLNAFVCATGIFCSRRLGKTTWKEFADDLESRRSFTTSPKEIWD